MFRCHDWLHRYLETWMAKQTDAFHNLHRHKVIRTGQSNLCNVLVLNNQAKPWTCSAVLSHAIAFEIPICSCWCFRQKIPRKNEFAHISRDSDDHTERQKSQQKPCPTKANTAKTSMDCPPPTLPKSAVMRWHHRQDIQFGHFQPHHRFDLERGTNAQKNLTCVLLTSVRA